MAKSRHSKNTAIPAELTLEQILIRNMLIEVPESHYELERRELATLFANLGYYGYALSAEACKRLMRLSLAEAESWWNKTEPALKAITGANRNMGHYVVYKNFPKEVLLMPLVEYWLKQIMMYVGLPNQWFTEAELARIPMKEDFTLKILHLALPGSSEQIAQNLANQPSRWTPDQYEAMRYLLLHEMIRCDEKQIPYKENQVRYAALLFELNEPVHFDSATDVLRFAIALSDGDVTMSTNSPFRQFRRHERRRLLAMLNGATNLQEDMARDNERWKRLIYALHPFDYRESYPHVCEAANALYSNSIETFNSKLENLLVANDPASLDMLAARPGEFMRRLQHLLKRFGPQAVDVFRNVVPKLTVLQLVKTEKYLKTITHRNFRTFAPRSNWNRMQVVKNTIRIPEKLRTALLALIAAELRERLPVLLERPVNLDPGTLYIKLPDNDAELTPYGRGTVFHIPENITFIRTASYWQIKSKGNIWFDNGWNFFDDEWKSRGVCCWNAINFNNGAAIFSGDPTNSKDLDGKACQMIDLYLDKLQHTKTRYAVWNILAYSRISFNKADDVFAALQWGEKAETGKLFEPARCQMAFPLRGDNLTKYIVCIDIRERKLVYLDANLRGHVNTAEANCKILEELMPAFWEYVNAKPTVADLFAHAVKHKDGLHVLYSDAHHTLKDKEPAYVFRPENDQSSFTPFDISQLLNA